MVMNYETVIFTIGFCLALAWTIYLVYFKSKPKIKADLSPIYQSPLKLYEPPKEIQKIATILSQCERWVETNDHELASTYYEAIANECRKLSEEHKRMIE